MLPNLAQLSLNTEHTDGLTDKRPRNDSSPIVRHEAAAPTAMDTGLEFCVLLTGQSRCMNATGNRSDLLPSRSDVRNMLAYTKETALGDSDAYTEVLKNADSGNNTIALMYYPTNDTPDKLIGQVVAAAVLGTAFNSPSKWLENSREFYGFFWSVRGSGASLRHQGNIAKWQDALDEVISADLDFTFKELCATGNADEALVANVVTFVNAQFIQPTLKIARLEEWSGEESIVDGHTLVVPASKGLYEERVNAMSLFRVLSYSPASNSFWSNIVKFTACPRKRQNQTVFMRYVNQGMQP